MIFLNHNKQIYHSLPKLKSFLEQQKQRGQYFSKALCNPSAELEK